MKTLILAITLLASTAVGGQGIDIPTPKTITVTTVCESGYKFVIVITSKGHSGVRTVAITQLMSQQSHTNRPQPVKCNK